MPASVIRVSDGRTFPLLNTTAFGRRAEATICLKDSRVSRRHATIRKHGPGDYWLHDLGSFNGSFVNDQRVTTAHRLHDGDLIRIFQYEYRFELDEVVKALKTEAAHVEDLHTEEMILLVSDIKGYTHLSELLPADMLAQVIGRWYDQCERIIRHHGGIVDKFIGDAVFAYWEETGKNQRFWSLAAAYELNATCEVIYESMRDVFLEHRIGLNSGVGVHLGEVSRGKFGKGGITMIGDAVNTAFRIEALTRELGHDLLVSRELLEDWPDGIAYCRDLHTHHVRGRTAPVHVYYIASNPLESGG